MPTACRSSTLDSRLLDSNSYERSGNVYENKGRLWKTQVRDDCLIPGLPDLPISRSPDHRISDRAGHNGPPSEVASVSNATLSSPAPRPPKVCTAGLRGLINLGGCEMSLKARAGCCGSALRLRADEAGSSPESVKGDRLARELQFIFGYWKPQV